MQNTKWATFSFAILSIVFSALLLLNAAFGVFYDTAHAGDTWFLLGAAWRAHEGLTPAVDFGHFYGGLMAQGISFSMQLFGHGVFVFDYFTLLLTLGLGTIALLLLRPRISWWGYSATFLLIATLLLTRHPLEMSQSITRIVSTHSFLYNRFAFAVLVITGLFVALPHEKASRDGVLAVLAGALTALVCLTKPTFVVLALGLPLACLVQRRWRAVLGVLAGTAAVIVLLDPGLARLVGSFDYAMAHVGEANDPIGLIRKSVQIPLAQPVALTFALGTLYALLHLRIPVNMVLALVIMAGTGIGLAATMGGNGNLGQLALPVLLMIAIAAAELVRQRALPAAGILHLLAAGLVLAFSVPHLLNSFGATAEAISKRELALIPQGPFERYLSLPEERPEDLATQYEKMADGVTALTVLGDPSDWGIVADGGLSFEYAVLARPVPNYPLWQRATAPEFTSEASFVSDADIVMISRSGPPDPVTDLLRRATREGFIRCLVSEHWVIFSRPASQGITCAP